MGRSFGSRTLVIVSGALIVLLASLAMVQYRWSTRVAAADIQREKEHLDSAASLFGNEFDNVIGQTIEFLQEEARPAVEANTKVTSLPKLISQLYYVDSTVQDKLKIKRLGADGLFAPVTAPDWVVKRSCAGLVREEPPALVVSVYDIATSEIQGHSGARIFKAFSKADRCFIGVLDLIYLRNTLFPQLIRQSFGEATTKQYDFAVTSQTTPRTPLYGTALAADVRRPFFLMSPLPPVLPARPVTKSAAPHRDMLFVKRVQTGIFNGRKGPPEPFGPGIWELNIAHKGLPLAATFERTRQQDLLLSVAVESLLVAGIVFLLIAARRMQRLADQKMHFIAGVSHELRTPVSAIAMLSRNQADGLVTAPDKVKQYGHLMHQESRRLNEMVEQTLQYAEIHSELRRPPQNEIDLHRLIEGAVDERRDELIQSGFAIEMNVPSDLPPVLGDAKLLRIAFDNLLSNARKHAGDGRWIRISARYATKGKEVLISVEDRGSGIDPADQAEIFEPFTRGRAAIAAQIPGSGLGLSLVRSAAEAHRGTVTLKSAPGRGSTFTLHLPV